MYECKAALQLIMLSNIYIEGIHHKDLEAGKSGETQRKNMPPNGDSYELVYANLDFTNADHSTTSQSIVTTNASIPSNSNANHPSTQMFAAGAQPGKPLSMHLAMQQAQSLQTGTLHMTQPLSSVGVAPQVLLHQPALVGAQQVLPTINPNNPINPLQVPPKKQPPATRPKPQIRPQHMRTTQSNGIEYAKLAFATKADL